MKLVLFFLLLWLLFINEVYSYHFKSSTGISKLSVPSSTCLYGKKDKKKGAPTGTSDKSERQGQADKFDALTRKYMYTLKGLTKALPDGSRTILKVLFIYLSIIFLYLYLSILIYYIIHHFK
jgi:hypothetical protein